MKPVRFPGTLLLSFFLCFGLIQIQAQNFDIKGCIRSYTQKPVLLQEFDGADSRIVDSVFTDLHGCFHYSQLSLKPAGMYRLLLGNRQFLDLVYTGNPIDFETDAGYLIDSMRFTRSAENETYYQYLRYRLLSQYRLNNLRRKLLNHSPDDDYAHSLRDEIVSLAKQEQDFTNSLINKSPESLTSKLILIDRVPEPDPLWSKTVSSAYNYEHFPETIPFNDTSLLRTNALSAKIISFLSLVLTIHQETDSIEAGFREAAFRLLAAAESEETMFGFVQKYLSDGFQKLGYAELGLEIRTIPRPCCLCPETESNENNSPFQAITLTGKQFPAIKLKVDKTEVSFPQPGLKTIVMLAEPDCQWSRNMEAELIKFAPEARTAGYDIYMLYTTKHLLHPLEGDIKIMAMNEKSATRLHKFTGTSRRPLLIIVGKDGLVDKATTSWLDLRHKLML